MPKDRTAAATKLVSLLFFAFISTCTVESFALPTTISSNSQKTLTRLSFGLPSWFTTPESVDENVQSPNDNSKQQSQVPDPKIGWSGVIQLITAGLGAPFLGDYQGIDEETGRFMFTLEANNLVDADGNSKQTSMPYFESGWVDPEDEKRAKEGFKFPWQK
ncbi:hypothetical protein MPSEU_001071400 [Mayamaea pseudoterrestris]|nr:hypothetical protein MPSEU_001071400 [Mayamaea pseudoterrestris]